MPVTPITNQQPYLVLSNLFMREGIFPSVPDGSPGEGAYTLGMLRLFAGDYAWEGTVHAEGGLLNIAQNSGLFAILLDTYGGNFQTTFGLPDLRGTVSVGVGSASGLDPVDLGEKFGTDNLSLTAANLPAGQGGALQPIDNHQESIGVQYLVRVNGTGGLMVGGIVRFAGEIYNGGPPKGFLFADGSVLQISAYPDLFAEYGTTYGGNGTTTFALPDLRGRAVVGASADHPLGQKFGSAGVTIDRESLPAPDGNGDPIGNEQPSIALHYIIAVEGYVPSVTNSSGFGDEETPYIGELQIWGGSASRVPDGWVLADGRSLSAFTYPELADIIGNRYGGNGTSFNVPDLRGRVPMGRDADHPVGSKGGTVSNTIADSDLPDLAPIAFNDTNAGDAVVERADGTAQGNVLSNDTDINDIATITGLRTGTEAAGGALSPFLSVKGTYGTLTLGSDGSYVYQLDNTDPDTLALGAGQVVTDAFTYRVTDGSGLSDLAQLNIAITGRNDAPAITSNSGSANAAVSVNENSTAVATVAAADADGSAISYSIAGGADAALFAIDGASGALTFRNAPDYEAPADANGDNVYDVVVRASDGVLTDDQALAVAVTDLGNQIQGTSKDEKINSVQGVAGKTATGEEDVIHGGRGDDTINGGLGSDTLTGGAGEDTFVFRGALSASNVDVITDFKHNTDVLSLHRDIFAIGARLSADEFYTAKNADAAHDKSDRIIYDTKSGKLFYDADGKGGVAAVHFATLSSKPTLDHGDFDIV